MKWSAGVGASSCKSPSREVYVFKAYLEGLPNVDPERIAVMGWGYGAVWAVHSAIAGFDYQTAVVFSSPSSHFSAPAAFELEWLHAPILVQSPQADPDIDNKIVVEFEERATARNGRSKF